MNKTNNHQHYKRCQITKTKEYRNYNLQHINHNFYLQFSDHDNFSPFHLLYYEEAHFGHGGHYQSIYPLEPIETSEDNIGLSDLNDVRSSQVIILHLKRNYN